METLWITYVTSTGLMLVEAWPGSRASVSLPMRHVVERALSIGTVGVILMHNHPSGDPRPSVRDREFMDQIVRALNPLGIRVFDHLIVANCQVRSFRDLGLLLPPSPRQMQPNLFADPRKEEYRNAMTTPTEAVTYVCEKCHGNNVSRDAWGDWNVDRQAWELRTVFDYAHCHDCDGETRLVESYVAKAA